MRVIAVGFISLVILSSCRGPNEPAPLRAPELRPPLIPGIFRTDESGNNLGTIGNPDIPEDATGLLRVDPAYPNPFYSMTTIQITQSGQTHIRVWIVRGIGFAEDSYYSGFTQIGNQLVATPGGLADLLVMDGGFDFDPSHPIAQHNIIVRMDETFEDGYYRCYIQADEVLLWTDLLLLNDVSCINLKRLGLEASYCD
ncbi:MAG: hypothetical protein ACETWG_11875 [Candidatus Neomarinimicrobiota bacterium]